MARSKMIKGMEKASKKVASTARGAKGAKASMSAKASRTMAKGMAKASRPVRSGRGSGLPRKGDVFRCDTCGMELKVTVACDCEDPDMVHMSCCGQELTAV